MKFKDFANLNESVPTEYDEDLETKFIDAVEELVKKDFSTVELNNHTYDEDNNLYLCAFEAYNDQDEPTIYVVYEYRVVDGKFTIKKLDEDDHELDLRDYM